VSIWVTDVDGGEGGDVDGGELTGCPRVDGSGYLEREDTSLGWGCYR
jgi:hypothetical protein